MKLSVLLNASLLLTSLSSFAQTNGPGNNALMSSFTCYPEVGGGDEVIELNIDSRNFASIKVDGGKDVCGKGKVSGKFVEYGKSTIRIACKKGLVILKQEWDETPLDISALKLGLSDTTYMCN